MITQTPQSLIPTTPLSNQPQQTIPTPITPSLYVLKHDEEKGYYAEKQSTPFEIIGKSYGKINFYVENIWRAYTRKKESTGVILTGQAGSGKSRLAEVLCNLSITQKQPVLWIKGVKPTDVLVDYLSNLNNFTILIDEFGKIFNIKQQNRMLSMLGGMKSGKKLFIFTENNTSSISPFILNRPTRARYHLDYSKVPEDVIEEYCDDYDVTKTFYNDLIKKYLSSTVFSFDQLKVLVDEHKISPEISVDEMLEYLNAKVLIKPQMLSIDKVELVVEDGDNIQCKLTNKPMATDYNRFKTYDRIRLWVDIEIPPKYDDKELEELKAKNMPPPMGARTSITVNKNNITHMDEEKGVIECLVEEKYLVKFLIK